MSISEKLGVKHKILHICLILQKYSICFRNKNSQKELFKHDYNYMNSKTTEEKKHSN